MNEGRINKHHLIVIIVVRITMIFSILLGTLLLSAGKTDYWQAWLYLFVLFMAMMFVIIFLFNKDPELLERRMRTKEKQTEQKLVVRIGLVCYLLIFLIPGLDQRFEWSGIPWPFVIVADVLVLIGYGFFVLVLRENSYASRIVEVESGQQVIATGPYAVVRHPMYAAIILMFTSTPIALGSWWAILPAVLLIVVLLARISNEEDILSRELDGYREYMQKTRHRLIPGVW